MAAADQVQEQTPAKGKTFWAKITAFPTPPGGGAVHPGPEPIPPGGGDGGDGGDGGEGGNGGDGGAVHPGPEPIPPGGLLPGGGRPRGFRTIEFDPKDAPQGMPTPPGKWVVVDAGRGKPPVFGFMGSDFGLEGGGGDGEDGGEEEGDKPQIDRPGPPGTNPPAGETKKGKAGDEGDGGGKLPSPGGREAKGHWVAVQYPMKAPKSADPVFVWVPQIDENFGVKHKSGNGNGNGNGNGEED